MIPDNRALNILLVEDDEVDVMNVRRAFDRRSDSLRAPVGRDTA